MIVGKTKHSLLEHAIFAVPETQTEAEAVVVVGDTGETIFTPAISSAARVLVWEVRPGITVGAVILTDGGLLREGGKWSDNCASAHLPPGAGKRMIQRTRLNTGTYPLALTQVRTPTLPVTLLARVLV